MTPWIRRSIREGRLEALVQDFAQHDSWRCGHPDRYPWNPNCPCGLTAALREAGCPTDWAHAREHEATATNEGTR